MLTWTQTLIKISPSSNFLCLLLKKKSWLWLGSASDSKRNSNCRKKNCLLHQFWIFLQISWSMENGGKRWNGGKKCHYYSVIMLMTWYQTQCVGGLLLSSATKTSLLCPGARRAETEECDDNQRERPRYLCDRSAHAATRELFTKGRWN